MLRIPAERPSRDDVHFGACLRVPNARRFRESDSLEVSDDESASPRRRVPSKQMNSSGNVQKLRRRHEGARYLEPPVTASYTELIMGISGLATVAPGRRGAVVGRFLISATFGNVEDASAKNLA